MSAPRPRSAARRYASGDEGGGGGADVRHRPQPVLPHPWRRDRRGRAAVVQGAKTGTDIPKNIVADGPVVTKANADGMLWMQEQFLI